MKTAALSALILTLMTATTCAADTNAVFAPGARILFQGDSITDGGRSRNDDPNRNLGTSYALLLAAQSAAQWPERKLTFFNRGISGNKVPDLINRWQKDAIELKPTVISILIGVNDIWHPLNDGKEVSVEKYEAGYDQLLTETRAALPGVKIMLLEPFITPGRATSPKWDVWQEHLKKFQAVVAKLGAKHNAPVVKLQAAFDAACQKAPPEYWAWDGVHPTAAGNQLIADEWVRVATATWPEVK